MAERDIEPMRAMGWGLMLAEARPEIFFSAWMITLPGIALFLLVLFVNLLGDGVRDITAPEGRA